MARQAILLMECASAPCEEGKRVRQGRLRKRAGVVVRRARMIASASFAWLALSACALRATAVPVATPPVRDPAKGEIVGKILPPYARALVSLYREELGPEDPEAMDAVLVESVRAGEDGAFRFAAVPGLYTVSVRAAGFLPAGRAAVRVQAGQRTQVEIGLHLARMIPGTVTHAPTGRAWVAVRPSQSVPAHPLSQSVLAQVDPRTRRFSVGELWPGTYDLALLSERNGLFVVVGPLVDEPLAPTPEEAQEIREVLATLDRMSDPTVPAETILAAFSTRFRSADGRLTYERVAEALRRRGPRPAPNGSAGPPTHYGVLLLLEVSHSRSNAAAIVRDEATYWRDEDGRAVKRTRTSDHLHRLEREGGSWRVVEWQFLRSHEMDAHTLRNVHHIDIPALTALPATYLRAADLQGLWAIDLITAPYADRVDFDFADIAKSLQGWRP